MKKSIDEYIGRQYGTRTIIGVKRNGATSLIAQCECGSVSSVNVHALRRTGMPQCNHCRAKRSRKRSDDNGRTYNGRFTRLFNSWRKMLARCESMSQENWKWYGGRGITVCDEWHDFDKFRDWALASGYERTLQIDRIDNNGPYSPENCRWVSATDNCNNRRSNHWIDAWGETKTLAQWSRDSRCVVKTATVRYRLLSGMCPEEAMSLPVAG